MSLPIIIIGGGGHAKVLIDTLLLLNKKVLGYTDIDAEKGAVLGLSRLGDDEKISEFDPKKIRLVNGMGSINSTSSRKRLYEHFLKKGFQFENVIHPASIVSSNTMLEEGIQIMAGAVVQPGSRLGADTIVNTCAVIDHDCNIGAHVHIAPGAVLSGNVRIEEGVHVGTGAKIIQGLVIGSGSLIGAGSVVIEDVPPDVTVVGVPGKIIHYHGGK
jgi:sugar O-acyltransferase (sialic acid O-acetyltransferase NeuD family)